MKRMALLMFFGLLATTLAFAQQPQFLINLSRQTSPSADHPDDVDDVVGQVTVVDAKKRQFTLRTGDGQVLTVTTDTTTKFDGFDEARLANAFSSIAVGQLLEVDIVLIGGGALKAKEVELAEHEKEGELEGVVSSVPNATQFNMLVLGEIKLGKEVVINIQNGTKFEIDRGDVRIPSGLSFRSSADLLVGQTVQIRPLFPLSGSRISTVANRVQLKESRLTARVQSVTGVTITLDNLPALFATGTHTVTSIEIQTSAHTEYTNVNGIAGLKPGDTISVSGLLFKSTEVPALVAEKIRKR